MKYQDSKHGFSFDLPESWTRLRRSFRFFWAILGLEDPQEIWIRFASRRHRAYIDLSVGPVDSTLVDLAAREVALRGWFTSKPGYTLHALGAGQPTFGGEQNVLWCEYSDDRNVPSLKVSVVRSQVEYSITCKGDYHAALGMMEATFRFA